MLKANEAHKLCVIDDETGEPLGELCEEVYVKEEHIDLLSHDHTVHINLWSNGEEIPISMNRSGLNRSVLRPLLQKGFTMLDDTENIKAVLDYLLDSCKTASKVYEHSRLGFCEVNGKAVFLADEVIGDCGVQSHYFKPKLTAPKGTLDSWKALVQREVIGHPNMELALAIGASAPVAHLLQEAGLMAEVPIWGLIGESSTGKTSCLRAMASIFGSAEEGSGLIKDFNATERAILAMLQDYGIVHLIDESTIAGRKNFADMLYKLSKGMDKLTYYTSNGTKDRQEFTGAVVITGENSLLEQSDHNLGLHARVVELGLRWTDDAAHARRISQGFRANYGTAIVPYAQNLLKLQARPDVLADKFNCELRRFKDAVGEVTGEQERLLNMYVSVILSARVSNKALGLKLNVSGLRTALVEAHRRATTKKDLAQELYDAIMAEVTVHGHHFKTAKEDMHHLGEFFPADLWGEYAAADGRDALWIVGNKFREFACKNGFANYTPYLRELSAAGLIKQFSDGFTSKHPLGSNSPRCYCIYLESCK